MEKMIAEEWIEIDAPVPIIWELLTDPDKIKQWSSVKVDFNNDDILALGSEFDWKDGKGQSYAKGTVIEFEPEKYIRTSVHFNNWETQADPDALTDIYSIFQKNGKIILTHTYGDFASVPDGQSLYKAYLQTVTPENKELQKIKEMAEE